MKTILVSGASGIVGYGILRSLRKSPQKMRLIGTTIYKDSVAQGFCDLFEQAPRTGEAGYLDWLLQVIKKHRVDLIIPGIEVDTYTWAEHVHVFKKSGAKVLLNNTALISLCRDKWTFYETLRQKNVPQLIESSLSTDFDALVKQFGFPFLLKPRCGSGARGIVEIATVDLFRKHQHEIGAVLMAQPYVGNKNEEFTSAVFCDGKGGFYAHMTLKRELSKEGFTDKAEVVMIDEMKEVLLLLCGLLKPIGPTNFQFRMHQGMLKLLEINPRISSSTSIRTAFGFNECLMGVEYFLENKKPAQPVITQGKAVRYIEDFIFFKNQIN